MDVGEMMVEIEDGITHDLPRSVVGDIAAAINGEELDTLLPQTVLIEQEVALLPAFAERVNMWVLIEK